VTAVTRRDPHGGDIQYFIGGGELEKVMRHFHENTVLMWEQRSCAATSDSKLVAARRSAPTLPPRPAFSSAAVNMKRSWGNLMKMRVLEGRTP
jgi:hypothetical protein